MLKKTNVEIQKLIKPLFIKKKDNLIKWILVILAILIIIIILFFVFKKNIATKIWESESKEYNFTIIVLPDTQKYSKNYPDIFTSQTKWIADNKNNLNIQMVIHLGDIVNDWKVLKEWERANKSFSILDDNNVPYSIIPGNHDYRVNNYSYYDYYFSEERYRRNKWYKGNYNKNHNNYQIITINGKNYLFINLHFCPSNNEVLWADNILAKNSRYFSILSTHAYLDDNNPPTRSPKLCSSTKYIWDMAKKHENLRIIMSGHIHKERRRTDKNNFGKPVHQILSDYQDMKNGGNGYLRIMTFIPGKNKIFVQTYSPYLNKYRTGNKSQFELFI